MFGLEEKFYVRIEVDGLISNLVFIILDKCKNVLEVYRRGT